MGVAALGAGACVGTDESDDKPISVPPEFTLSRLKDIMSGVGELFATGGFPIDKRSNNASVPGLLSRPVPDCEGTGDKSMPSRSFRKSPPEEVGAGTSSELRSSRSTSGAAAGLETPFGRLSEGPLELETAVGNEPALLPLYVASSKTGILSTKADLMFWCFSMMELNSMALCCSSRRRLPLYCTIMSFILCEQGGNREESFSRAIRHIARAVLSELWRLIAVSTTSTASDSVTVIGSSMSSIPTLLTNISPYSPMHHTATFIRVSCSFDA
uniref:Uncharacterized protein n=1 Tax=Opuntia streptacantha TaxID=393608 RepID=A0A7C9DNR1_OPUST